MACRCFARSINRDNVEVKDGRGDQPHDNSVLMFSVFSVKRLQTKICSGIGDFPQSARWERRRCSAFCKERCLRCAMQCTTLLMRLSKIPGRPCSRHAQFDLDQSLVGRSAYWHCRASQEVFQLRDVTRLATCHSRSRDVEKARCLG